MFHLDCGRLNHGVEFRRRIKSNFGATRPFTAERHWKISGSWVAALGTNEGEPTTRFGAGASRLSSLAVQFGQLYFASNGFHWGHRAMSVLVIQDSTSIWNRSRLDIGFFNGSATVYIASLPGIRVNPERCPRLRLSRDRREGLSGAFEAVVRSNLAYPPGSPGKSGTTALESAGILFA